MSTPISAPGTYNITGDCYLANDIVGAFAGTSALTFPMAGVILNLNGKTIRSTNGGIAGISSAASNNFVVTGGEGSWIDGFDYGVNISTPWSRVEGVIFNNIKRIAANLTADYAKFFYNVVNGVGGNPVDPYAVGVNMSGGYPVARGNLFKNIYRQAGSTGVGEGCAILFNASSHHGLAEQNTSVNDTFQVETIGAFGGVGGFHTLQNNIFTNFERAVEGGSASGGGMFVYDNHIWRRDPGTPMWAVSANKGDIQRNLIIGYPAPFTGSLVPDPNNVVL